MATAARREHPETSPEGQAAKAKAEAEAPGAKEVQSAMDKATEQGFIGVEVDQTDNAAYTVAGVTSGAETPETRKPE
jgi:fibronectin type 3 domain-containing protein